MTRLTPVLRPLWPYLRIGHRLAARVNGTVFRPRRSHSIDAGWPERRLPWIASTGVEETLAVEASSVRLVELAMQSTPVRSQPCGDPLGLRFWSEVVRPPAERAFVLDIDGGRLVGDFAATVTPSGRLETEVSPYWGRPWREHPIFLSRRIPPLREIDGVVLSLASPGSATNYYHSLMDALPRWGLFQRAYPDLEPDAIVVGHKNRWDRELVAMLGIDRHRLISPTKGGGVRAERLLVPSLSNRETLAPMWITRWLRERLLPPEPSVERKRLYVTRGTKPNTRRFVRETELLESLEERGFECFDPGAHSVAEQIKTFAAADVVVAPHGAGLVNLNFAPPGVRVLELFAPRYLNPGYWAIVDNIPGAAYRYLVADPVEPARSAVRMLGVQNDIDIAPARVLRALDRLLEI